MKTVIFSLFISFLCNNKSNRSKIIYSFLNFFKSFTFFIKGYKINATIHSNKPSHKLSSKGKRGYKIYFNKTFTVFYQNIKKRKFNKEKSKATLQWIWVFYKESTKMPLCKLSHIWKCKINFKYLSHKSRCHQKIILPLKIYYTQKFVSLFIVYRIATTWSK